MPTWGWICIGLVLAPLLLITVWVIQFNQQQKRLMRDGERVVARILLAHPCLYDPDDFKTFSAAFVVFTLDDDNSEEHLAYLEKICNRLEDFKPKRNGDEDEQKIGKALSQQITVGEVPLRLPDRITKGEEVYFATPNVHRRMLPVGKLTLDYIYLMVLIDGDFRNLAMIEYPAAKRKKRRDAQR
jgi:hypothetical protein